MRYLAVFLCCMSPAASAVEVKHWILEGIVAHLVVCDPATVKVGVMLAQGTDPRKGLWRSESFTHMVNRVKPTAAIVGSYFDMATNVPVCTIVSDGRLLVDGLCHAVLMVNSDARIAYNASGKSWEIKWPTGLPVGLASGPILVKNRQIHRNKRDEGFHDPAIFGYARRTAVGVTPAGKLVMLATNHNIGLNRWSRVAKDAGLTDAFNLDGGMSAALYGGGGYCVTPGRRLTSFLVIGD